MQLFDFLNAMTLKNEDVNFDNPEVKKGYQSYMINRFVSMSEMFVPIVNEINRYDVPKEVHYQYYYNILPKRKQYFKYIKKSKDLEEQDKKYIAEYFECSMREAEGYINTMEDSEIKELLNIYKYGKNKMVIV